MPEYLAPGVYVDEIERGPRPIEGVPTSTAAFLGETRRIQLIDDDEIVAITPDGATFFTVDGEAVCCDASSPFTNGTYSAFVTLSAHQRKVR